MQLTLFSLWWEAENLEDEYIHLQIKAVLKVRNKDKQKFQQFLETAFEES